MSPSPKSVNPSNHLYYGDNLDVLRESIASESVDLIYLDPPFNSARDYNILFAAPDGHASEAQITAFEDSWHWGEQAETEFAELVQGKNTGVSEMMIALRKFLGENDVMAYLTMMANRLIELHRVLKPTGSLFLHCDPTASHYLKIVLDGVFGADNFKNEIVWMRANAKGLTTKSLPVNHDLLFFYRKSPEAYINEDALFTAYDLSDLDEKTKEKYSSIDESGRRYQLTSLINPNPNRPNLTYEFLGVTRVWRWTKERMQEAYEHGLVVQPSPGAVPRFKRYLDEQRGKPLADVWTDIPPINSQAHEDLGYPTQKPVALLERVVGLASRPGDVVLDPFCGCGTAVHAAQKLGRQWIGIDITHLAVSLIEKRLRDAFPGIQFTVHGTPKDMDGARDLATRDKYQFQWWACSLVNAQPYQAKKKGADGGIDGMIFFQDEAKGHKKIVVSVKGGEHVNVSMVRDLAHVIEREKADIGLFVTLAPPTKPMMTEAVKEGFYISPATGKAFPKLQILTIEGLLHGTERALYPDLSQGATTFKKAKVEEPGASQVNLF